MQVVIGDGQVARGAAPGPDLIGFVGNQESITGSAGDDTIWAVGDADTIGGTSGADLVGVVGNDNVIGLGAGESTFYIAGNSNTVIGGGQATLYLGGEGETFLDTVPGYSDTVVGFNQAGGDRIELTGGDTLVSATAANGGLDTLLTLSDGSTILLKYVGKVDPGFFT